MHNSPGKSASLRRTSRLKKPSLKALESHYTSKLKNAGFVASVTSSSNSDIDDFELDGVEFEGPRKPKLLHEDEEVCGEDMFAFQPRKQRDSLALKVREAQNTPHNRSKMKSRIKAVFEDSGSEYELSTEDESSDSDDTSQSSEESDEDKKPQQSSMKKKAHFSDAKTLSSRGRVIKQNPKYTIDTEGYFASSASSKIKTSNNTLDKLQTPRLPQYELQKLLSNNRISKEHETAIHELTEHNKRPFNKWLYILNQNFNILLYGLGSKKDILSNFHEECLQDEPVIVINGFFPGLTIKNILDSIIEDLLETNENHSNLNQAVHLVEKEMEKYDTDFYLLINNIEAIKGEKAQNILAALATVENIHLIATIDHINAPLIWDHKKLSKFNFIWWDTTSFSTYKHETECEMSSMTQQNSALALSSLRNVFLSLTQNSKAIYLKVAKYQIENSGQYYQGMAFKDLYMTCRESFIVSTDLALKAQLSEFIDHKMIKTKRSLEDGTEYLIIPLSNTLLQKFMEENI